MQSQTIKMVLGYRGLNVSELARKLDKTPNNLAQIIKRDNFRESDLQAIAEALDCELVIQFKDKETGKLF